MENLTSDFDYLFEPDYRPTPGSLWERTIVYNDNGRLLERRDTLEYLEFRRSLSYEFILVNMAKPQPPPPSQKMEIWVHVFEVLGSLTTTVGMVSFNNILEIVPEDFPVTYNPSPDDKEFSFITYKPLA